MELKNSFRVPVPIEEAWEVLLDVERLAPCMPGAEILSVDGDTYTGSMRVKLGPMTVSYQGTATRVETDEAERYAVIEASAKETRGSGTANATVTTRLRSDGAETLVDTVTVLAITGKPAQFGRGVIDDVAARLIDQFSARLSDEISGKRRAVESEPVDGPAGTAVATPPDEGSGPEQQAGDDSALDLWGVVAGPILKRLVPAAAALAMLAVAVVILRKRARR